MKSIFLCHSHKDKKFVNRLSDDLKSSGVKVWVDEAELIIGDSLIEKISNVIESINYVGVVLSKTSIESNWVKKELSMAMTEEIKGNKIKVLPLLLEECKLPLFLQDKIYADFQDSSKYYQELRKVLQSINPNYLKENEILTKLFNLDNDHSIQIIYHCQQPGDQFQKNYFEPIVGGLSGTHLMLPIIKKLVLNDKRIQEPFSTKNIECPIDIEPEIAKLCTNRNMYLIDSPIQMFSNGKCIQLNWVTNYLLSKHIYPQCSVRMTLLNNEEIHKHPQERRKICYGLKTNIKEYYADDSTDFGLIIRAPNPYCNNTIVIIMAGVWASASHAAVQAMICPKKIFELYNILKWNPKNDSSPYFEAIFSCPKSNEKIDNVNIVWKYGNILDIKYK